jgi:hypothetical protein
MRTDLIHYILNSQSKFSLLIDESTSVSNVQSIIVYIRILFDGEICTYFLLGLLPLSNATAAGIEGTFSKFLYEIGLSDDVLKKQ